MDPYILVMVAVGLLVLLVAWLPMLLREAPLSLPIVCVGLGWIFSGAIPDPGAPLPLAYPAATERVTEFLVIIALMGSGLKLDRPPGWRPWQATWRLLAVAMPLSIAAAALLGWALGGLGVAAALLLGAALAPTDPVLAADVQVGPPRSGEEDEVRFSLTSEAGLNDGLAFPFTNLALAVAAWLGTALPPGGVPPEGLSWLWDWLLVDVAWKLAAGVAVGWAVGLGVGWLTFRLPNRARLSRTGDGFVALAMTLLSYGITEMAHGYGFLAVFVTALAFRHLERGHRYHDRLHDLAEQVERLLMMAVLVLFGVALGHGLLAPLTWGAAAAGLAFLFVARPLAALAGFAGLGMPGREALAIGFFGIRGVGSFYYLAYALNEAPWAEAADLWALAGFVVLVSVLLHGTTVTPAMRWLDRARADANAPKKPPPAGAAIGSEQPAPP